MEYEVHPTAIIESGAVLPSSINVGPYSIIHANVRLGENTFIGSHCEIGLSGPGYDKELYIGQGSTIRSGSVIYAASRFESRLETGHKVTLRERITAGHNLRVGTYTDIQGDVEIGNFVRMHSNVHISKFTKIGDCVWIFPFTVTTNDPIPPSNQHKGAVLEDFCIVSTASVLLPGIRIGKYSIVGAKSTVTRDVEPRTLVIGSPAKFIKMISEIKLPDGSDAYPWHKHLKEQYIEEIKAYYSG